MNLYNLSNAQKSIWLTEQFYKGTNINNITGTFIIKGKINEEALEEALNIFVEKYEIMRARFVVEEDGNIKQYFEPFKKEKFNTIHLKNKNELEKLKEIISKRNFKITQNKLYSFDIYDLNEKEGGVIVSFHHLIFDAWATTIFIDNLANLYFDLINDKEIDKNKSKYEYTNYIEKEQIYLNSDKYEKDKEYWKKIFSNSIDIENKDLQNDDVTAKRIEFTLDNAMIGKLKKIDKSFFNIYISALSIYFSRTNNLKDLLIGVPVLNRANFEEKQTVGMFVNTVPLRIYIDKNITFKEFININKMQEYKLFRHQKVSYEEILKIAKINNPDINYLFDTVVSYQNARDNRKTSLLEYNTEWIFNGCISNSLDIHITDLDDTGIMKIHYDYQVNKFTEQEIKNIHKRILNILNQIIQNNEIFIKDIEIITEEEKRELLELNNVKINYPKNNTIIDMFKKQVLAKPNEIAIDFEGIQITYKDLDLKSDNIAKALLKNQIQKSDIVGILLPRSLDFFVAMLGILKVGAIYLPIDIEFPNRRIEYMLTDSRAKICITNEEQKERISTIPTIDINNVKNDNSFRFNCSNVTSEDGCYVIYTSGTTGEPKGIIATHNNVVNYTYAFMHEFKLDENDVVLQQFTPSFDAFVEEFYPALLNGIKIFSVTKDTIYNIRKLESFINDNNITLISCSPLLLNQLNKLENFKSVKTFISGGDVLKREFYNNLIKYANVYNTYGPTETTVCSMYHKCRDNEGLNIPIGKTIANYKNFIISEDNLLLPKGYIGELCIGGNGVAKGYLNNEVLTNQKFIKLSFVAGRFYKTGDLCKINQNNEIEYIGRKDKQLKIRGYRVSLSEIEKMLNQYPGIENSFVVDFEDDKSKKRLCAYYEGVSNITSKEIKEYLQKVLPTYAIPVVYIKLDNIPMNINGKIDKTQLPNPNIVYKEREEKYIKPNTKIEKRLEEIWKKILNLNKISIRDNLFELGADSLSIIEFQTMAIYENWDINAQEIYVNPNIELLAMRIENKNNNLIDLEDKYKEINISKLELPKLNKKINNVLLTGGTGFLGAHILSNLIETTKANIYCIVRGKDKAFAEKRLVDIYNFYFNKNLLDNKNRVKILYGDITKENLGISDKDYKYILQNIDTVIHTAATVKHYGNEKVFREINTNGTKNIINFCINSRSKLHYISTISVSGQTSTTKTNFTENDFWIGQNYQDNVYIKSKFEAEYYIYQAILHNDLYAKIYRVGNLTGRYSDGVFQKNIYENAFYQKLQTIIRLKKIPTDIKDLEIDFTPIDLVSEAIKKLIFEDFSNRIVYHLYNTKTLTVENLIGILNEIGLGIEIIPKGVFLSENERKQLISIIYDIYSGINKQNINIENNITDEMLKKVNFFWKEIDQEYLLKIIKYMNKSCFYILQKFNF